MQMFWLSLMVAKFLAKNNQGHHSWSLDLKSSRRLCLRPLLTLDKSNKSGIIIYWISSFFRMSSSFLERFWNSNVWMQFQKLKRKWIKKCQKIHLLKNILDASQTVVASKVAHISCCRQASIRFRTGALWFHLMQIKVMLGGTLFKIIQMPKSSIASKITLTKWN